MNDRALVLGGGGVVGLAWETGVLVGLRDGGVDVTDADLVVGTSAGSTVGAQVAAGRSLDELLDVQLAPSDGRMEALLEKVDVAGFAGLCDWLFAKPSIDTETLVEIGTRSLAARTPSEVDRLEMVTARLGITEWPDRPLMVTAIDCATGEPVAWSKASGISLAAAVASSSAVPAMFPPVSFNGRRYYDGGLKSATWADLAVGHRSVLIIAPIGPTVVGLGQYVEKNWAEERDAIHAAGGTSTLIFPDDVAVSAFGPNYMDPSRRGVAAEHGRRQGMEHASALKTTWR